jgi:hypothetical protein
VHRGRCDEQCGRRGGDEERGQVLLAESGADLLAEALLERDGEKEGEQDLDAGLRYPQFLEQLVVVAVGTFEGCLVAHVVVSFRCRGHMRGVPHVHLPLITVVVDRSGR